MDVVRTSLSARWPCIRITIVDCCALLPVPATPGQARVYVRVSSGASFCHLRLNPDAGDLPLKYLSTAGELGMSTRPSKFAAHR